MRSTATTCRTIEARWSFIPLVVKKTDPGLSMKPGFQLSLRQTAHA